MQLVCKRREANMAFYQEGKQGEVHGVMCWQRARAGASALNSNFCRTVVHPGRLASSWASSRS